MLRTQALRSVARRGIPLASARIALPHVRMLATPPDPTKPSSDPKFDSAKSDSTIKPKGTSQTTLYLLVGGTAVAVGAWYYMQGSKVDQHAQRKADEEQIKQKAQELKEAGKVTAQDAAKQAEQSYDAYKASGKEKLAEARAQTASTTSEGQAKLDSYKTSASQTLAEARDAANEAARKAEQSYLEAKDAAARKAEEAQQTWGQWFGSWFGYGNKVEEETRKRA
ncbi:unnamed protein product [Somion occarium]|uniref:Uncharacterized protein n=1 Tax=Somion occarium TaxID=3059160 RepID=A0ABP1DM72_9APHY